MTTLAQHLGMDLIEFESGGRGMIADLFHHPLGAGKIEAFYNRRGLLRATDSEVDRNPAVRGWLEQVSAIVTDELDRAETAQAARTFLAGRPTRTQLLTSATVY